MSVEATWLDKLQDRACKYAGFVGECEAILRVRAIGYSAEQCLEALKQAMDRLKRELGEQ